MKYLISILLISSVLLSFKLTPTKNSEISIQDIIGAWETTLTDDNGQTWTATTIITEEHISVAFYNVNQKEFFGTAGGYYTLNDNSMTLTTEFNTVDKSKVGQTETSKLKLEGNTLKVNDNPEQWKRVDDGSPGSLYGAWLFTGRERDGVMQPYTPGERKTMKILSGTRFQWIAYHTGTGDFMGTGGGTYTAVNGKYVENIEFFSRNKDRVGASLEFEFKIDGNEWHHSGLNSRGEPLYEMWTNRKAID